LNSLREKLEEWAIILKASPKTWFCLLLAMLFPVWITLVGIYFTGRISFAAPLSVLSGPVREAILHRYVEVALLSFFGFLSAAGAQFMKTRRRLFEGY
jgi:hypothetical protein